MTEEDIFLSPGTIFNKDAHYSLQQERERLSKLLIEARIKIAKLEEAIKENKKAESVKNSTQRGRQRTL